MVVTVTPVNDNHPVLTSNGGGPDAAIHIAENTAAVATVTAGDADLPAQTLVYSIAGGADAAKFTIDSATGELTFVAPPDFESPSDADADHVYEVTVDVTDGAGGRDAQAIIVAVSDANEYGVSAISDSDAAENQVSETAADGTSVGIAAWAADGDATDTVSYSLDDDAGGRFQIDPATGAITVRDHTLLDYETAAAHEVTVRATSSDGSSSTQTLTIGLTDDTAESSVGPVSDSDAAENQVSETVADGTPVGITAWAADGDATDTVSYSLDDDAGGRFQIDPATGAITVRDHTLLDYETAAGHEVTVRATSSDGSSSTQDVDDRPDGRHGRIAVSDRSATATPPRTKVSETVADGATVGITAWAADGDATDTVSYSLDDDAGGRFQIDPATGAITVQDHTLLDYETAASPRSDGAGDQQRRLVPHPDVYDRPDGRRGRVEVSDRSAIATPQRTRCPKPWLTARRWASRMGRRR